MVGELWDVFERLARGRTLIKPTLVSKTFADQMMNLFELEGVVEQQTSGQDSDVDFMDMPVYMHALECKLEEGTFETELFN